MFLQGQKIGKYEIIRSLGSGGFGSVFLAKDVWLDIKVAIKVPHKQSVELYKLLKEPRLQAVLNHPNIVRLLAAEKVDKIFFFVMEYIRGRTLERILLKDKALEVDAAVDFTRQLCAGVDHAHRSKIIHRDLRPSNIMVSEEGQLKITDFGTSAWLQNVPYATTRIGSPPYMAPEQFLGKATYASDIYSIGCILYEMVVGRPPIFDPDPFKILERAQEGRITPPRLKNNRLPRLLDEVIMKCLAARSEDRYGRPSEIAYALAGIRGEKPAKSELDDILGRIRARERPGPEACWNCHRRLPLRAKACPYCGESV